MSITDRVRAESTRYGLYTILGGLLLLLGLRVWTSPIVRIITGRGVTSPRRISLFEFLLVPSFLVVVGIGIGLFLWEPHEER